MDEAHSPEEFARLMALPEDHPDRRRAAASPQFEAAQRMLAEFERPGDALLAAGERAAAEAELARRLAAGGVLAPLAPSPVASPGPARAARREAGGWRAWLRAPAARGGLVFAGALVVVGIGWVALRRGPGTEVMRGAEVPAFELTARREGDALVLGWQAVAGADAYALVFLAADHTEAARLAAPNATMFALRAATLPAGVAAGSTTEIQVVALRGGLPIATSPARTVLLP